MWSCLSYFKLKAFEIYKMETAVLGTTYTFKTKQYIYILPLRNDLAMKQVQKMSSLNKIKYFSYTVIFIIRVQLERKYTKFTKG